MTLQRNIALLPSTTERRLLPREQAIAARRIPFTSAVYRAAPAVIGIAAVLVLWQIVVVATGISPDLLPSPVRVAAMAWQYRNLLWQHSMPTILETLVGLAATIVIAALLATVADFFPVVRRFVYPILVVSQTIPMIVLAPLMVIWFGYGLFPKILIIVLVIFFSITVALTDGFDSTDPDATNLLRSMGASRLQQFLFLRLPNALPHFFTGLRIAVTWSVTAAIFGDYVGAEKGLGIFMQTAKNDFRTDLVLAAVLVVSVLSLVAFGLVILLRRLVIPWHTALQQRSGR